MRELSDESVEDQADAFLTYVAKGGDPIGWWGSKDFATEDRDAIVDKAATLRGRIWR